ncbi:MAG: hypothetical protein ACPGJS_03215 [Flammeovirgaceae bacterium]
MRSTVLGKPILASLLFTIALLLVLSSCELQEEKLTADASIQLTFSTDTVFFDTIFTSLGSITKRFKAYNPSENAIEIDEIAVGGEPNSFYSMVVNGTESNRVQNVRVLGKDSVLILVKVNIDPLDQDLPFIVQDSVTFVTNGNFQDVKLVSWGQDANFLRDSVLDCNTTWDASRPYVIFDDVLVDSNCTLTMLEGTKVYMNAGSDLFVRGSLNILGKADSLVKIQSVRLDPPFDITPGQWGGIVFIEGSQGNRIEGAVIRNGTFGLFADPSETTPIDININQSIIENASFSGISSFGANITMRNTLVQNCIEYTVFCVGGGNYTFEHNTFANYSFDFFRENPQLVLGNFVVINTDQGEQLIASDLEVNMTNNIVWGSLEDEVQLPDPDPNFTAIYTFRNNLIRTTLTALDINGNLINIDPLFTSPFDKDYTLDTLSPAQNAGIDIGVAVDLEGTNRVGLPDLGAFERVD